MAPSPRRSGRKSNPVALDLDVGHADPERAVARRRVRAEQLEGTVVAGTHHGAKHSGLEGPAGEPPGIHRPLDQGDGQPGDGHERPSVTIEFADLTVIEE